MKIKLIGITVSSFQSVAENQTINFDKPGMYAVVGINEDDGGSNGAGKSSFTKAITAGILSPKYIDITNKETKNRILGIPPNIAVSMEINDRPVLIDRTIGGRLFVSIDGVAIEGKSDEIQEKFIKELGISADHYMHITHKMQGPMGGFLLMKDSDKKDFLGSFFDTSKIEKAVTVNDIELKSLNKKTVENSERLRGLVNGINLLKAEVDQLTEKVAKYTSTEFLSNLASKKSELTHKEIELQSVENSSVDSMLENDLQYQNLNIQLEAAKTAWTLNHDEINTITMQLEKEALDLKLEINAPVVVPSELQKNLSDLDKALQEVKIKQTLVSKLLAQKSNNESQIKKLEVKAAELKQDTCSTCGQAVSSVIFQSIKDSLNLEFGSCLESLENINKQISDTTSSSPDENLLSNQKTEILSAIAAFKASKNKDHVQNLLATVMGRLSMEKQKQEEMKRSIQNSEYSISYLKSNVQKNYELQIGKLKAEISSIVKDIQALDRESSQAKTLLESVNSKYNIQLNSMYEIEQDISRTSKDVQIRSKIAEILSINGFIGYIFDTVLEEINMEVNENIKDIPVISRLSMYFTPDKAIKSTGAMNKSIVYKIFDRSEDISFETLSGSEKQSLLEVVEAAIDTILCRRLGVDINYKILDEQFGWVDGTHKEAILEFIKQKYHDKIILIVDHGSELNAAIDHKIVVTKKNGISTIACQTQV